MAKLEDLEGRRIVKVRVMPDSPPEESGQLEVLIDGGGLLEFDLEMVEETDGKKQGYSAVLRLDGKEVYRKTYR